MSNETKRWYSKDLGNGQGLVIEETTGRNVAVTYRAEDATLVAQAPDLARRAALADKLADALRSLRISTQKHNRGAAPCHEAGFSRIVVHDNAFGEAYAKALTALAAYDAEKGGAR